MWLLLRNNVSNWKSKVSTHFSSSHTENMYLNEERTITDKWQTSFAQNPFWIQSHVLHTKWRLLLFPFSSKISSKNSNDNEWNLSFVSLENTNQFFYLADHSLNADYWISRKDILCFKVNIQENWYILHFLRAWSIHYCCFEKVLSICLREFKGHTYSFHG